VKSALETVARAVAPAEEGQTPQESFPNTSRQMRTLLLRVSNSNIDPVNAAPLTGYAADLIATHVRETNAAVQEDSRAPVFATLVVHSEEELERALSVVPRFQTF
jgi:hypothetical protein